MSEEEQMRIAIEESMREFEQENYLTNHQEEDPEDNYTTGLTSPEPPQSKSGGEIIKQCSAIVYETCAQSELELDTSQGQLDSDEKDSNCRSKYFVKKEKCSVCDRTKAEDSAGEADSLGDGKCSCRTDSSDCNGNEVKQKRTGACLNGGKSQPEAFVPKLSSESDFKSMFDDDDFDQGACLIFILCL
jgi:hypothetical protein